MATPINTHKYTNAVKIDKNTVHQLIGKPYVVFESSFVSYENKNVPFMITGLTKEKRAYIGYYMDGRCSNVAVDTLVSSGLVIEPKDLLFNWNVATSKYIDWSMYSKSILGITRPNNKNKYVQYLGIYSKPSSNTIYIQTALAGVEKPVWEKTDIPFSEWMKLDNKTAYILNPNCWVLSEEYNTLNKEEYSKEESLTSNYICTVTNTSTQEIIYTGTKQTNPNASKTQATNFLIEKLKKDDSMSLSNLYIDVLQTTPMQNLIPKISININL